MNYIHKDFFIFVDDPPSKRAILKAALKLFVRDGFNATNIRAIGKEAGYSNPALFKFFKSKEALALYLFERCYLYYADAFASTDRSEYSFEKNLESILNKFFEILNENPETFIFVQDHLREFWPHVSLTVRRKSILKQIHRLLEQGQREKVVHSKISSHVMVAAFAGFLIQFVRMFYFGEFTGRVDDWKNEIKIVAKKMLMK